MTTQPLSSFFKSRDELDAALDEGELTLSAKQNAVFRYLIEHAVFDKRADDWGYVTTNAAGVERIARRIGYSPRAVKDALAELEDMGQISRYHRPKLSGGRMSDRIRVDALFGTEDDTPESVASKVQEMHLPEGAGDAPYESAGDAPSYLYLEELLEQRAGARPSGGPSAQGHRDSGDSLRSGVQPPAETPLERSKRQAKERGQLHQEYADRFHDGSRTRADRHANDQTDGRGPSIDEYMRQALAALVPIAN